MNLQEWRRQALGEITLPSGLHVKYNTRFSVFDLAAAGQIPQVLIGAIQAGQDDGQVDTAAMLQNMPDFVESANALIKATWTDPPVGEVGSDTVIGLDEIPTADKVEFFRVVAEGSGVTTAQPFPQEPGPNGAAALAGEDVPSTAVNDTRDSGG